ncbi:MAG: DNA primase [Hyphomicrobiales bacterium]|nr:DNA primase [Hyphomicrobiales bacterium]
MKFTTAFLDEIRARVPVSQVAGARVRLRKEGREWRGLSPFNAERTPSFFVNDQKGFYHDFSSGKHGDIFSFLTETEGLSFPEAVERLAGMAGVPMPARSPEGEERERKRASLHDVMALAQQFFAETLHAPIGAKARGYLADRRLDPATQRQFGLGYSASDRYALRDALAARGVDAQQMIDAGLLTHGEGIAVPYDRFRDRVMFPIHDRSGRVVAFGGRAMEPGAKAKYLNSPEGELFHKGGLLFNHHRARKAAHDTEQLVVVEGYVDVIAMTQVGFPQTVAPLGTALTADQCGLLWTMANEPILCFDGDKAGHKAAFRAIDVALPLIGAGKSLRFAMMPEGQDPDDLARSGGAPAIAEVLGGAQPMAEMLFLKETEDQTFETPEKRAALEKRLRERVGLIADETLRRHYAADMQQRLANLFGVGERAPARRNFEPAARRGRGRGLFNPGPRTGIAGAPLPAPRHLAQRPKETPREISILAVLLGHPALLEQHFEDIATLEFAAPTLAAFRDRLLVLPAQAYEAADALAQALETAGLAEERDRILRAAAGMPNWWCLKAEAVTSDAAHVLRQTMALQRSSGALNRELKLAEQALASDPTEQNLARLLDIKSHLTELANAEAAIEGFGDLSGRRSASL